MTKENEDAIARLGAILRMPQELVPLPPDAREGANALASQMEALGTKRWGWSPDKDPETWNGSFLTRDEAVADAAAHASKFYVVSGTRPEGSRFMPSANAVIDMLGEAAADAAGEAAEDFPDVPAEAEKELDDLLDAWSKKHLSTCSFWIADGEPELIEVQPDAT